MTENSKRRFVTVVATVEVPTDLWEDVYTEKARAVVEHALERANLPLVPCDWSPDPDTIADVLGVPFGAVTVVDLNP